ncbi:MAG: hypothetical protein ACKO3A_04380 [Opitutia bacterium]
MPVCSRVLLLVAARAGAAEAALPIKLFDPAELGPRIAPSEATLLRNYG